MTTLGGLTKESALEETLRWYELETKKVENGIDAYAASILEIETEFNAGGNPRWTETLVASLPTGDELSAKVSVAKEALKRDVRELYPAINLAKSIELVAGNVENGNLYQILDDLLVSTSLDLEESVSAFIKAVISRTDLGVRTPVSNPLPERPPTTKPRESALVQLAYSSYSLYKAQEEDKLHRERCRKERDYITERLGKYKEYIKQRHGLMERKRDLQTKRNSIEKNFHVYWAACVQIQRELLEEVERVKKAEGYEGEKFGKIILDVKCEYESKSGYYYFKITRDGGFHSHGCIRINLVNFWKDEDPRTQARIEDAVPDIREIPECRMRRLCTRLRSVMVFLDGESPFESAVDYDGKYIGGKKAVDYFTPKEIEQARQRLSS